MKNAMLEVTSSGLLKLFSVSDGLKISVRLTRIARQQIADALLQFAGAKHKSPTLGDRLLYACEVVEMTDLDALRKTANTRAANLATEALLRRGRR